VPSKQVKQGLGVWFGVGAVVGAVCKANKQGKGAKQGLGAVVRWVGAKPTKISKGVRLGVRCGSIQANK
jgi:hypothetical protein